MRKNRVTEFEPRERILEKAKKLIESPELFSAESDQAVSLLLRAMKHADRDLKREIMFVLATFARDETWPSCAHSPKFLGWISRPRRVTVSGP